MNVLNCIIKWAVAGSLVSSPSWQTVYFYEAWANIHNKRYGVIGLVLPIASPFSFTIKSGA